MKPIYVTGDVHGDVDCRKFYKKTLGYTYPELLATESYVIVCGDMGVCFDAAFTDAYMQHFYETKPWITLFCDGNHENFDVLNQFPVTDWNGGKVHMINDHLIHLMRGQVYTIEGKTFFVMGGATSTDKYLRKEHESWWAEELPNMAEYTKAERNLKAVNYTVDYVISHCCSSRVQYQLNPDFKRDDLTDWFNDIDAQMTYKHWYFGHYHFDQQVDDAHTCLYHKILRIE